MNSLINRLIKDGYLKSDNVIDAFSRISRVEFVPEELELQAEANVSLPIGYGQMIYQPLTVAFMLELLDVAPGQKILNIGSGSGWITALLAEIVGESGKVIGIEKNPSIFETSKKNIEKFGYISTGIISLINADGSQGLQEEAPFDRIIISAEANEVPEVFKSQLKTGGKLVMPVNNCVHYLEKKEGGDFYEEDFPGFSFTPLIIDNK